MGKLTFGATGLSYQCDKVEVKVDGAPKCPRCNDRVYFNEEKKALGKTWHKRCFTCTKCNKGLDSTNYNQNNAEVLCTACYRKTCGPRVYGYVSGASLPTTLDVEQAGRASPSASSSSCSSPSLESCPPQHARTSSVSSINRDDPQCCPSCGKRVYFAEEVKVQKRKWHRLCFKCQSCSKSLEPGRCSEHEKQIYCQSCYGRMFGPRGYGYAGGSGSLLLSEVNDPWSTAPSYRGSVSHQQYSIEDNTQPLFTNHPIRSGGYTPEPECFEPPTEPIRGTQEWTESVFAGPSLVVSATVVPPRPNPGYYAAPAPAYTPLGHSSEGRGYYSNEPNY